MMHSVRRKIRERMKLSEDVEVLIIERLFFSFFFESIHESNSKHTAQGLAKLYKGRHNDSLRAIRQMAN